MQELKLAIFDVAGTVIEDHGEVVSSFVDALAAHGIGVGSEELMEFKGAAKREVIRFMGWRKRNEPLSEPAVEAVYTDFERLVNERYEEQLAPIAGAEETFESLRKRGMQMALTTGFGQATLDLVVRRLGWEEWFAAKISSDEVKMGRPAPYLIFRAMERCGCRSVHEVLNVGDTPLDLQSAENAGVAVNVGVLSGLYRRERLMCEPQDALLASVADLPALLANWK
jgi:phosphonatase-like hydrolase